MPITVQTVRALRSALRQPSTQRALFASGEYHPTDALIEALDRGLTSAAFEGAARRHPSLREIQFTDGRRRWTASATTDGSWTVRCSSKGRGAPAKAADDRVRGAVASYNKTRFAGAKSTLRRRKYSTESANEILTGLGLRELTTLVDGARTYLAVKVGTVKLSLRL